MMLLALMLLAQDVPAEVHLVIPRGACRLVLDGKAVPFSELRARLKPLADAGADIHFQPDPKAHYACVEKVLAILRGLPGARRGIVGHERYDPAAK
jgi:biopolymer transport protein ExbD